MKISKYIIALLFTVPVLASCTKVIDLKLGNNSGRLVIEGNITDTAGPQVIKLSRNVPMSTTNTYPAVTGATVTVTDQAGQAYTFTESTPGTYTNSTLAGVPGNNYSMSVTTGTSTYKAVSIMPAVVKFDSLTYRESEFNTSKHKKVLTVNYQDPAGVANQYRFVVWINNVQVKTIYAFNDDFNEGRYVKLDLRVRDDDDDNFGVYAGDIVTVEMQCIDNPIYTYWYTLMQQSTDGPGGGVTPADPPTNISPVSLGYFSAHTTQRQTIVIK